MSFFFFLEKCLLLFLDLLCPIMPLNISERLLEQLRILKVTYKKMGKIFRHDFLSFCDIFCSFTPLLTPKIKVQKNCKKHLEILSFFTCVEDYVWFLRYKVRQREFFVIFGFFQPFDIPNNPKNQDFKQMKRMLGDIIILDSSTPNVNHMMYSS